MIVVVPVTHESVVKKTEDDGPAYKAVAKVANCNAVFSFDVVVGITRSGTVTGSITCHILVACGMAAFTCQYVAVMSATSLAIHNVTNGVAKTPFQPKLHATVLIRILSANGSRYVPSAVACVSGHRFAICPSNTSVTPATIQANPAVPI